MAIWTQPNTLFPSLKRCHIHIFILFSSLIFFAASAHGVTLPYSDHFTGTDGSAPSSDWSSIDQDGSAGSYHQITDNQLEIISGGDTQLSDYYSTYLSDISGDFTVIVQVSYTTATHSSTRNGIQIQNDIGDNSTHLNHVQLAYNPGVGFVMTVDENGDGTADTTTTLTPATLPTPPNVWLKLVRNGNTMEGYYSRDARNWTRFVGNALTSVPTLLDVGLFGIAGNTGANGDLNIARFDNFSLIGTAGNTYTFYEDADDDSYGNPDSITVTTTNSAPDGYVTNSTDCDDTNDTVHPTAEEVCDGLDNDCDGNIDEGHTNNTYYRDSDGDGYGTVLDTHLGCQANAGYVATGGDCDDDNANIHPGAGDICGNSIDEDCAGGDAACFTNNNCENISNLPLSVSIAGAPSLIMFILDDSGSMAWTNLCPETNGRCSGYTYYSTSKRIWTSQWFGYNGIYYNPANTYSPWPTYSASTFTNCKKHPKNWDSGADNIDLTDNFVGIGYLPTVQVSYGHYFMWSAIESNPFLIDLGHDDDSVTYYDVTGYFPNGNIVNELTLDTSPPADVQIPQASLSAARQNFANWYTYYRTREAAAKSAISRAMLALENVYVGLYTINNDSNVRQTPLAVRVPGLTDNTSTLLTKIFNTRRAGGTPLRRGLRAVGRYYDATDEETGGIGNSPYFTSANGGDCQQAFAILTTDGYSNGGNPNVGDADFDDSSIYDGHPYGSARSNRLSDVAMHYYERDLHTDLANGLHTTPRDPAPHQHMVTYTVSFGLTGNLTPNDTCPMDPDTCPTWPTTNTNRDKIDYLWLAAVAGRGRFVSVSDTTELTNALRSIFTEIGARTRTSASISVSSQKLETGLKIYQGSFISTNWSGDLQAYSVTSAGVVNTTASWSARTQLNAQNWDTGRRIFMHLSGTTHAFRHTNLTTDMQATLSKDQLEYIRGDDSNEVDNGGSFRVRTSKLGDIVHSSPFHHDDVVYVGANDGMLHAFNADNGNELFAFVPSFVIPNLNEYTSPLYSHKFMVDGTPTVQTVGTKTWLVSGLRRGGRGFFGIDVTSADNLSETTQRPTTWEYPATGATDNDLGFTFSEITIADTAASSETKPLVFAGNGYDSTNGKAVLYILRLNGTLLKAINTNVGGTTPGTCNGLSTPLVVDLDGNGKADNVYAGDLLGNLWKFDVFDSDTTNWDVAYMDGTTKKPLITVKNSTGQAQPITSKPSAMRHCAPDRNGIIVIFGTGRMLSSSDPGNTNVQSIYGIWDWYNDARDHGGVSDPSDYYYGEFNIPSGTPAVRDFSNIDGNSDFPSTVKLTLLKQAQVASDDDSRTTTNRTIDWFSHEEWLDSRTDSTTYTGGNHVGWYMDLPETRERVITKTQIREGKTYVVSITPTSSLCSTGGDTILSILDACNGGQLDEAQFDSDDDSDVDSSDTSRSGKKFADAVYYAPAIIEDKLFLTKDAVVETQDETSGLFYWRILE